MGNLTLFRFNGTEKHRLVEARAYATYKGQGDDQKVMLWFETETDPEPLVSLPDPDELQNNPDAEITVYLDQLDLKHFGVREFELESGYNEDGSSLDARLYYFEHQEVHHNTVRIEYKGNGFFHVQWCGMTMDVNYYDGSRPDTRLELEGDFFFEEYETWQS
ncbi:hypothetical protein MUG84_03515 [Paenibacillus sp. KQZ6P-2]|uniref:Uncharacterized protein n=1 Tax=Paenibacillus mangrovi TaxID=2931978 RepID=A0A9X1WK50_9BACL|nr:hypothetical protein [Paenibacillus mangrovi]MCJ8010812.1 hypothetical protein [Paenibacillus mangrovi]